MPGSPEETVNGQLGHIDHRNPILPPLAPFSDLVVSL